MPNVNQPQQDKTNNQKPEKNRAGQVGSSPDFEKPDKTRIDREGEDPEYPNVQGKEDWQQGGDRDEPSKPYASPGDKI